MKIVTPKSNFLKKLVYRKNIIDKAKGIDRNRSSVNQRNSNFNKTVPYFCKVSKNVHI